MIFGSYDVSTADMIIIWLPLIALGLWMESKRQKDFREGRIKGVPQSKNFFDWMFYNYRDNNKDR